MVPISIKKKQTNKRVVLSLEIQRELSVFREKKSSGEHKLKNMFASIYVGEIGKECMEKDLRRKQFDMFEFIMDIYTPKSQGVSKEVRYKKEEDVNYLLKLNPEIFVGGMKVFLVKAKKLGNPRSGRGQRENSNGHS